MVPWRRSLRPWGIAEENEGGNGLRLTDGSRIGVIGGGPAGSFFSYFLLEEAERMGIELDVDLFEPHDYGKPGPASCNHCGGVISESLVQILAAEGIILPPEVVQRGIDSYCLHTDHDSVRIETPLHEKRIAAVFRGGGPRGTESPGWRSFDGYLQELAVSRGARILRERVSDLRWEQDRPVIEVRNGDPRPYDLVTVATGVNTQTLQWMENLGIGYTAPKTTKTYICEIPLGSENVERCIGSSMHVFLLNLPRLEFAALIPKGDHVTMCLLGEGIDDALVEAFLHSPAVQQCIPPDWFETNRMCHCGPKINVGGATLPVKDRIVFIGDSLVTRLYKDGIGAAYRTAKAASHAAILHGVGTEAFESFYWPSCQSITRDNTFGGFLFFVTRCIRGIGAFRRAMVRMTRIEQQKTGSRRRMSLALWDLFTGSAPYREVFFRFLHPLFIARLGWNLVVSLFPRRKRKGERERSFA